jgi:hypothetical protein
MTLPIPTVITVTASAAAIAFATLLDHYHYGSASFRNRLRRLLNAVERIDWQSFSRTTSRISLSADSAIFGPRLISPRSLFVGVLLLIGATIIPTYFLAQRNPGPLKGHIIIAMGFASISIPLGLVGLHFARWCLRIFSPRASAISSVGLTLLSVLAAQIVLLMWIAIFSVLLLGFLTLCYNHMIYLTDSGPIVALLIILAIVYAQAFLPAALFPLAAYVSVGAIILCLRVSNVISRIISNFLKSQIDTARPNIFTEGAKVIGAFLIIIVFGFDMTRQTSLPSRLNALETALQHNTVFIGLRIASPICDRFVPRPTELHVYLFAASFFLQASGKLFEQNKLTPEFMNRVFQSFGKRWNEHLHAPLNPPQAQRGFPSPLPSATT